MNYQSQLIQQNIKNIKMQKDIINIETNKIENSTSDLIDARGFGPALVQKLADLGYKTQEQLKQLGEEGINKLDLNKLQIKTILNFINN